jgi:hypothetical protein
MRSCASVPSIAPEARKTATDCMTNIYQIRMAGVLSVYTAWCHGWAGKKISGKATCSNTLLLFGINLVATPPTGAPAGAGPAGVPALVRFQSSLPSPSPTLALTYFSITVSFTPSYPVRFTALRFCSLFHQASHF